MKVIETRTCVFPFHYTVGPFYNMTNHRARITVSIPLFNGVHCWSSQGWSLIKNLKENPRFAATAGILWLRANVVYYGLVSCFGLVFFWLGLVFSDFWVTLTCIIAWSLGLGSDWKCVLGEGKGTWCGIFWMWGFSYWVWGEGGKVKNLTTYCKRSLIVVCLNENWRND